MCFGVFVCGCVPKCVCAKVWVGVYNLLLTMV